MVQNRVTLLSMTYLNHAEKAILDGAWMPPDVEKVK